LKKETGKALKKLHFDRHFGMFGGISLYKTTPPNNDYSIKHTKSMEKAAF